MEIEKLKEELKKEILAEIKTKRENHYVRSKPKYKVTELEINKTTLFPTLNDVAKYLNKPVTSVSKNFENNTIIRDQEFYDKVKIEYVDPDKEAKRLLKYGPQKRAVKKEKKPKSIRPRGRPKKQTNQEEIQDSVLN